MSDKFFYEKNEDFTLYLNFCVMHSKMYPKNYL